MLSFSLWWGFLLFPFLFVDCKVFHQKNKTETMFLRSQSWSLCIDQWTMLTPVCEFWVWNKKNLLKDSWGGRGLDQQLQSQSPLCSTRFRSLASILGNAEVTRKFVEQGSLTCWWLCIFLSNFFQGKISLWVKKTKGKKLQLTPRHRTKHLNEITLNVESYEKLKKNKNKTKQKMYL